MQINRTNIPCKDCLVFPVCLSTYVSLKNVVHTARFIKTKNNKQVVVPENIVGKCSRLNNYITSLQISGSSKKTRFSLHDIIPIFKGKVFDDGGYAISVVDNKAVIYKAFYNNIVPSNQE